MDWGDIHLLGTNIFQFWKALPFYPILYWPSIFFYLPVRLGISSLFLDSSLLKVQRVKDSYNIQNESLEHTS